MNYINQFSIEVYDVRGIIFYDNWLRDNLYLRVVNDYGVIFVELCNKETALFC